MLTFLKNWTLPVAIVMGTVAYLLFANIPALDSIGTAMAPVFYDSLPWFMFFILLVTFCKIDFRQLLPVAWHFYEALVQVLLVVIVVAAVLLLRATGDTLTLLEAVLCCVIAPCACAAAVVTAKMGGNMAQVTTYNFLSNLITALLVPVAFPLVDSTVHLDFWPSFWHLLTKVCMVLVLPMAAAYVVKHYIPALHRRIVAVRDLSFYLWAASLAIVTGITVRNIAHAQTTTAFLVLVAAVSLAVCVMQFAIGRMIGAPRHRAQEAAQSLGQKNTSFAIWIAYAYLNPLSSVGPGCYILWQNCINSVELWYHRRNAHTAHDDK